MIVGNGFVGLWALGAHVLPSLRRRALWWTTGFAQVAVFVQIILGVAAMTTRDVDVAPFHMFYGFIALVAVGIIYSYRQQLARRIYLLYGFGGLFVMGLGIRGMLVGPFS